MSLLYVPLNWTVRGSTARKYRLSHGPRLSRVEQLLQLALPPSWDQQELHLDPSLAIPHPHPSPSPSPSPLALSASPPRQASKSLPILPILLSLLSILLLPPLPSPSGHNRMKRLTEPSPPTPARRHWASRAQLAGADCRFGRSLTARACVCVCIGSWGVRICQKGLR